MELTYLMLFGLAVVVAIAVAALVRDRVHLNEPGATEPESPFAVSTEGMKTCPNCGMGNLWTDRTCMSCGQALKG